MQGFIVNDSLCPYDLGHGAQARGFVRNGTIKAERQPQWLMSRAQVISLPSTDSLHSALD